MCIAVDIIGFRNFGLNTCANARKFTGHISSRADALNIFKFAHVLIIDTLDDLGTGGDRNAKQLKLTLQDFGFMVALVVTVLRTIES
jgi:hypothetical protein